MNREIVVGSIFNVKQGNKGESLILSLGDATCFGILIGAELTLMNGKPEEAVKVSGEVAAQILKKHSGAEVKAKYEVRHSGDAESLVYDPFLTYVSFTQPEVFAAIVSQYGLAT